MAVTNPSKFVTVRRLSRFYEKIRQEFPGSTEASAATCEDIIDELT